MNNIEQSSNHSFEHLGFKPHLKYPKEFYNGNFMLTFNSGHWHMYYIDSSIQHIKPVKQEHEIVSIMKDFNISTYVKRWHKRFNQSLKRA